VGRDLCQAQQWAPAVGKYSGCQPWGCGVAARSGGAAWLVFADVSLVVQGGGGVRGGPRLCARKSLHRWGRPDIPPTNTFYSHRYKILAVSAVLVTHTAVLSSGQALWFQVCSYPYEPTLTGFLDSVERQKQLLAGAAATAAAQRQNQHHWRENNQGLALLNNGSTILMIS